jgi:hypothetical protein
MEQVPYRKKTRELKLNILISKRKKELRSPKYKSKPKKMKQASYSLKCKIGTQFILFMKVIKGLILRTSSRLTISLHILNSYETKWIEPSPE